MTPPLDKLLPEAVDRSRWMPGEWDDEPDARQWFDEEHGFWCLILRGGVGSLCGYIAVPEGHEWYGQDEVNAYVHYGVTFSAKFSEYFRDMAPDPTPFKGLWLVGFDCAHAGDRSPDMEAMEFDNPAMKRFRKLTAKRRLKDSYKNIEYVTEQVRRLASQAAGNGEEMREITDIGTANMVNLALEAMAEQEPEDKYGLGLPGDFPEFNPDNDPTGES